MNVNKLSVLIFLFPLVLFSCWKNKSPEGLPRLKEDFKKHVEKFEKKKITVNKNISSGIESLSALKSALENAKNEDKEFAKVYGDWEKVDKKVSNLNKEYEDLKAKSSALFQAMTDQTNSLNDAKNKADLLKAISSAKVKYNKTLANTEVAIGKLRKLHADALDVIKALEVAVALNSFDDIDAQMKSIASRVDGIMEEINVAVDESKKLYEQRIKELN